MPKMKNKKVIHKVELAEQFNNEISKVCVKYSKKGLGDLSINQELLNTLAFGIAIVVDSSEVPEKKKQQAIKIMVDSLKETCDIIRSSK